VAQYDVDLRDYWRILKKRKIVVIVMVCLVGLSSYGFAKLKEPLPLYKAVASVKIEQKSSMASFFSSVIYGTDNMITQAFIITSFPVLVQTAKLTGMVPPEVSDEEIRNNKSYLNVVKRLKSMISAEQQKGTRIINIEVVSGDSREAAFVANSIAEAYRHYNIQERNRETFETKAFIEKQLELTSQRLVRAEEDLRVFKEGYALIALDAQTINALNKLSEVENAYEEIRRQKEEVISGAALMDKAKGSFENIKEAMAIDIKSDRIRALSAELSTLILKRKALLFDYTDRHPHVLEVNSQIQGVLGEIKRELNTLVKGLEKRESDLFRKMVQLRREYQAIPDKALQLERLQREVRLQESLYSQLKEKYQEVSIQESGKIHEVNIVRPALVSAAPINIPSKAMIIITGIIMGLVIGIVFTFVAESLDTSIGTIEDVESLLGVPVQGLIPVLEADQRLRGDSVKYKADNRDSRYLITYYDPKSLVAEAFRSLRTNLQFLSRGKKEKSFLVTSSFVQEGKTFNVVNLALSMAQAGEKVLLVESDLRRPTVHKTFGLSKEPGVTDYVLGNYRWQEIVNSITDMMLGELELEDILKIQGLDNLHIITAGTAPLNPFEILRSAKFSEFLKEAYNEYDFLFFDAPPIMPVADAAEIAGLMDGVILVYKVGKIGRGVLKRAKLSLDNVNAKVLGVVLNNVRPEVGPDYFKYQTQYYYEPSKPGGEKFGLQGKDRARRLIRRELFLGKYFRLTVLIIVIILLAIGIFWIDLLKDLLS